MKKSGYNKNDCVIIALHDLGIQVDQWLYDLIKDNDNKGVPTRRLREVADHYNLYYFDIYNSPGYDHNQQYTTGVIKTYTHNLYIRRSEPIILINQKSLTVGGIEEIALQL